MSFSLSILLSQSFLQSLNQFLPLYTCLSCSISLSISSVLYGIFLSQSINPPSYLINLSIKSPFYLYFFHSIFHSCSSFICIIFSLSQFSLSLSFIFLHHIFFLFFISFSTSLLTFLLNLSINIFVNLFSQSHNQIHPLPLFFFIHSPLIYQSLCLSLFIFNFFFSISPLIYLLKKEMNLFLLFLISHSFSISFFFSFFLRIYQFLSPSHIFFIPSKYLPQSSFSNKSTSFLLSFSLSLSIFSIYLHLSF